MKKIFNKRTVLTLGGIFLVNCQFLQGAENLPLGVVIAKDPKRSDQFAQAIPFSKLDSFPNVVNVQTTNGSTLRLVAAQVVTVFTFPDPTENLLTAENFQIRAEMLRNLKAAAEKYPNARDALQSAIQSLELETNLGNQGNVRFDQRWHKKEDWERLVQMKHSTGVGESLTDLSGKKYNNTKVTAVEPDAIVISHEAGVAKIPFTQLPEEIRKKHGYDPMKAEAFARSREKEQALAMAEAVKKAEMAKKAEEENRSYSGLPRVKGVLTIREIESDLSSFVGTEFEIVGSIDVANYYNYNYDDASATHYCFQIQDTKGYNTAYVYVGKGTEFSEATRRDVLKSQNGLLGRFRIALFPSRYDPDQTDLMGELVGTSPPDAPE